MTTVKVLFLASCGDDLIGERKAIALKRAEHLQRQGYVRIIETEDKRTDPARKENAVQKNPRVERRG